MHYVINFVFSIEINHIEAINFVLNTHVAYSYNDINYTYLHAYKLSSLFS